MPETSQPSLFSSLDPPETKPESPYTPDGGGVCSDSSLSETFRHSGWRRNRGLIYASLLRTRQTVSRIAAFLECGLHAYVYRTVDPPHAYRLGGSSCRDKFCLPCARDRSHTLATNIVKALRTARPRFLTLTLRHSDRPLAEQLDRLYRSFAKLRARAAWKSHVIGGCAILEIKWIESSQAWHPHLHCLVHGRYFDQRALKSAWYAVTGDSYITDIRAIPNEETVARYVTKYAGKPFDNTFINRPGLLDEAIEAVRARRLCLTFGTWRGIKLTEVPCDRDWESLGSFECVIYAAINGDPESMAAIESICKGNTEAVLQAAETARPPPIKTRQPNPQLIFEFHFDDRPF